MSQGNGPVGAVLRIPETVRRDVGEYREHAGRYLAGETSDVAFRAYRVPMGIYEQREAGRYMVRIRIGAGLVSTGQLRRIAELSREYGNGILHVTTRQDIQIHEVDIAKTADVLEGLLEAGLSARGGGGNTVRNVSACARSGICAQEKFEVAPYAVAVAEYLLQDRSSFNLPRKYKIVFSGCSSDCGLASVADLGFFAEVRGGRKGFEVYAGGGLGANPAVAVRIEEFVEAGEVFEVAEAVKRLFDKQGDRSNKHRARLRYVLGRVGEAEFVRMYKQERAKLKGQPLRGQVPEVRDILAGYRGGGVGAESLDEPLPAGVWAENAEGLYTVRVSLGLGDIKADELERVADIAEKYGSPLVRTTQLQNLLVSGVKGQDVAKVRDELKEAVSGLAADGPQIVACTGAATCKLGLCLSRGLAEAIGEAIAEKVPADAEAGRERTIRISGCPNSCANHYIASVGFQGRAKRVGGRLMPCYDVMAGGVVRQGEARLAEKVGTVPAKRIPEMMARIVAEGIDDEAGVKAVAAEYGDFGGEFAEEYFYDYGAGEVFSLAGRGPGECGAGVMDVITVDIDEAKAAIKAAGKAAAGKEKSEAIYRAVVAGARALLVTFGAEPKKEREIFAAFGEYLVKPGWVAADSERLLEAMVDYRMGDVESVDNLLGQAERLVARVEELFKSLDASLKFTAEPVGAAPEETQQKQGEVIDLRGVGCPLNFVKAKIRLETVKVGDVLEVLLDDGEPVKNVPASFADQGQEIVSVDAVADYHSVKVRRKK